MASHPGLYPVILFVLIFYHSKAAVVPDKVSSAHGKTGQGMTSHGLDLADLSLPPEVITEALFSQTDLLQDQLEQCEEMVRNNLKGDDTAEVDGIEGDEDEDDDNGEDEDDEDELNRKIAQLAVNVFSHSDKEDLDNVISHDVSSDMDLSDAVAASSKSGDVTSPTGDKDKLRHADDNKDNEEEGEEYVVYEYEDVTNGEHVEDKEKEVGGGKDAMLSEVQENLTTETTILTTQTKQAESETDSADSDAEEAQTPPEEVNISNIITNDNHSHENTSSEIGQSPSNQTVEQQEEVTQDEASIHNLKNTAVPEQTTIKALQSNQDVTTPKNESAESSDASPKPVPGKEKSELQVSDNNSEESRTKRSLSLDQLLLSNVAEGGTQRNVHKLTFGKGRIRRQTSLQEEIQSWSLKHGGGVEEEASVEVLDKMLRSALVQLQGGNSLMVQQENSPAAPQSSKSSQPRHSSTNPTWKESKEMMEVNEDATASEKQTGKDVHDVIKMAEKSTMHDVTKITGKTLIHDVIKMKENSRELDVIKMAEEFLTRQKLLHSARTGGGRSDQLEMQRLLATLRAPTRAERVRRRRSVLGQGLSPERYVPLIDQLVERLKYLQHSVQVCHMLLPQGHPMLVPRGHLPANHTLA